MKDDNTATCSQHNACEQADYVGKVILHVSDLHFLKNPTAKRINVELELFSFLDTLDPSWKPCFVCVTGDVADKNSPEGYTLAEKWIQTLLRRLELSSNNLVMCPGNHDIDIEKARTVGRPKNAQEIEEELELCRLPGYEGIFSSFIKLCKNLGMSRLDCNDYHSHLFGVKEYGGLIFLVCNSCWFCKCEDEGGNSEMISIGLSLLEGLDNKYDFSKMKQENPKKIIALIHHPEKGLNWIDTERFRNRPALGFLTEKVDLVLTGHLHSLPVGKNEYNATPFLNCGATLQDSVENTFALIRIEEDRFLYQFCRTDNDRFKNRWFKEDDPQFILCNTSQEIVNAYYDNKGTLSALEAKLSGTVPAIRKPLCEAGETTTPITFESMEPSDPKINVDLLFRRIKSQIANAERHIEKLGFIDAFDIADCIERELESIGSVTQSNTLSEIYTRLALIECTRDSWLHHKQGMKEDYSRAKKYFERAKNALKK